MELTEDIKDEIRELIQTEILKAFNAAFSAAQNLPVDSRHINNPEKQKERENLRENIMDIGKVVKTSLQKLEAEAQAKVVEKTNPEQAENIRRLAAPPF